MTSAFKNEYIFGWIDPRKETDEYQRKYPNCLSMEHFMRYIEELRQQRLRRVKL